MKGGDLKRLRKEIRVCHEAFGQTLDTALKEAA